MTQWQRGVLSQSSSGQGIPPVALPRVLLPDGLVWQQNQKQAGGLGRRLNQPSLWHASMGTSV